ncbi:MAG: UDP-3-O-(3-hydroxymyristoyl)glucosamine N-acyltransferase [Planctomycetes bacterium]|nr:UDP-3-O-(3-hydroxymyristoyl)glucosamine N-acyltransferase [Planctomycetota bacterium]MBI3834789.1 UDP-3-O-(3-hydroxymyristoyl)glucosamine N-acyltransferase [Planctomycetota bacterium]
MTTRYTIRELAGLTGGEMRGVDNGVKITGVADVSEATPTDATWVSRSEYESKLKESRAGIVLVPKGFGDTAMPAILCENIERAISSLLGAFAKPSIKPPAGIHPTAVVHPSAAIGSNTCIGPHVVIDEDVIVGASCVIHSGVFIGRNTSVGDDCFIWPNVVIRDGCQIGSRVIIHPNSVIGSDGFGFYYDGGRHHRFPHTGGVRLEDEVEIGACTCVDRSKFGWTIVGRGTKIDNFCQIAHNVRIGRNCAIAAMSGICGSVHVGDGYIAGGRTSVLDNSIVGNGVRVAAVTTITKDIEDGATVFGFPAQDIRRERRERAAARKVPELLDEVQELRERLERLEASTHHQS